MLYPLVEIYGLAILNEELFICRIHRSDVEVYDTTMFKYKTEWRVQDLLNPTDLVCNGNHLCFFDFKDLGQDCEIFIVTSSGELVNKWSTGNNWGTISAAKDLHIILIAYPTNRLIEYSPDGQLLRQIVLTGADILNPWHAIKLTNGDYVVCYGRYGLQQHRVSVVRLSAEVNENEINIGENNVIKSFGGEKGSSSAKMDVPIRLDVSTNGFIYVADHHNGRILVLDTELKLKRELVSANDLGHPRRLHLDEEKGRLLVSDYFRVLVCQLSRNHKQWFDINPANKS